MGRLMAKSGQTFEITAVRPYQLFVLGFCIYVLLALGSRYRFCLPARPVRFVQYEQTPDTDLAASGLQ